MYSAAVAWVIQAGSVSEHSFCLQLDNMMLHGTWPSPVLKICDFGELLSRDEQSMACTILPHPPTYGVLQTAADSALVLIQGSPRTRPASLCPSPRVVLPSTWRLRCCSSARTMARPPTCGKPAIFPPHAMYMIPSF